MINLDEFVRGYVESALFSSSIDEDFANARNAATGEDWAPDVSLSDYGFTCDDVNSEDLETIRETCRAFIEANQADLATYAERMGSWYGTDTNRGANATYSADESAGIDFWLTRNGHGAGFWDRGLDALGERLSDAARPYGEAYLMAHEDESISYYG